MDALPDGLRLSSQSAGIGGYGYKLDMFVIPAERLGQSDRDLLLQELGRTFYSYPERSCSILAWEPLPQPRRVDHQHDVNKPPGVPALQSRTTDPLAAPSLLLTATHTVCDSARRVHHANQHPEDHQHNTQSSSSPQPERRGRSHNSGQEHVWGPMEQDSESDTRAT
jgi:hypothetical protein